MRQQDHTPLFLLLRAYAYWDFPKGRVEAGEEPFAAALREVREETSLEDLSFPWGRIYCETPVYGRAKVARYYIATTATKKITLPVNPELGRPEHVEYRWLTYEQAKALLGPRVRRILDWAYGVITAPGSGAGP